MCVSGNWLVYNEKEYENLRIGKIEDSEKWLLCFNITRNELGNCMLAFKSIYQNFDEILFDGGKGSTWPLCAAKYGHCSCVFCSILYAAESSPVGGYS